MPAKTARRALDERQLQEAAVKMNVAVNIRLAAADLAKARALAERKGLPYQTYIKMLLHEALEAESAKIR